jgi:DNA-directed RNA polymerase specialized sigma24 family protein
MKERTEDTRAIQALERLRLERDWTYRSLAGLVGIREGTLYSVIRRGRANARSMLKIRRLLDAHRTSTAA